jgi:hypothetical protein
LAQSPCATLAQSLHKPCVILCTSPTLVRSPQGMQIGGPYGTRMAQGLHKIAQGSGSAAYKTANPPLWLHSSRTVACAIWGLGIADARMVEARCAWRHMAPRGRDHNGVLYGAPAGAIQATGDAAIMAPGAHVS